MVRGGQPQPHIEQWQGDRVSNAFCPVHIRGISTSKAAQCRRSWIMQGHRWMVLAGALSMRKLLVLATLPVVGTSLLVAVFGLHFWYLLLLPLLLFTLLLILPTLLHNRATLELVSPSPLAQSQRSSAGHPSHEIPELRSQPGLRTEDAPVTSTLADVPLVRVLETYDIRTTAHKHVPAHFPEDTAEQAMLRTLVQDFWSHATSAVWQGQKLPCSQEGSDASELDVLSPRQTFSDSE